MNITRQQQLLSHIKRTVSTQLRELNHETLHQAVVTDVLLSNDGRECRIYVDAPEELVASLNTTYRSEIQHRFMKNYARKIVPKLSFLPDRGELDQLTQLLEAAETSDES